MLNYITGYMYNCFEDTANLNLPAAKEIPLGFDLNLSATTSHLKELVITRSEHTKHEDTVVSKHEAFDATNIIEKSSIKVDIVHSFDQKVHETEQTNDKPIPIPRASVNTHISPETESAKPNQQVEAVEADTSDFTILLMGETGVGKSTFINAFYNYTRFNSLDDALAESELKHCIPSQFTYTDEDYSIKTVEIGSSPNETFLTGQSSTQAAQAYEFTTGDNRRVRIIDTPGMGDTRGVDIDKSNYDATISYLSQFKHLNAICFLVKPNTARLHLGFRYCFKELLVRLHKNSVNNICFCFTNTRSECRFFVVLTKNQDY